ncbi:D-glycero-alpha-D-manno-heptose-1,7-bisphosphate 7-phosphatase [Streptomyces sp. NPDC059071]|uniref:D-glycero-alpha-D-manno-heptose-1,7-bisphosphate 7-phosphatase n=1 Tax=unclassified Streptomyces TaxID=2593676 RepID=UPI0036580CAC
MSADATTKPTRPTPAAQPSPCHAEAAVGRTGPGGGRRRNATYADGSAAVGASPDASGTVGASPDASGTVGASPDASRTVGASPDAGSGGAVGASPDASRTVGASPDAGSGGAGEPWLFGGRRRTAVAPRRGPSGGRPDAVLFDRDGTLIVDVPYNGDPRRVFPLPGAEEAVTLLRSLGVPVGVVSNQSGVARGILTHRQVSDVQRRVEGLLGPFDVWAVCPHGPDNGCACRKPAPGLVLAACARLGARPSRTVVIGDIGTDMDAALAAGARGVLVPTPVTLPEEIAAAPRTAPDLAAAVRIALAAPPHDGFVPRDDAPAAGRRLRPAERPAGQGGSS